MMSKDSRHLTFPTLALLFAVVGLLTASTTFAQRLPGTENGEWRYLGGDAGHTRSSSLDQINGNNFDDLEVQWIWRSDILDRTSTIFHAPHRSMRTASSIRSPVLGDRSWPSIQRLAKPFGRFVNQKQFANCAHLAKRTGRAWPMPR